MSVAGELREAIAELAAELEAVHMNDSTEAAVNLALVTMMALTHRVSTVEARDRVRGTMLDAARDAAAVDGEGERRDSAPPSRSRKRA